jgi:ketosteroid isomerase-like protein
MYQAEMRYLESGGLGVASFATLAPYFAPDVALHQAEGLPYGGVWRGHEGIENFFLAMSRAWETFEMLEQTYLSETNPLVVLTQVRARPRDSNQYLEFPILQTVTVEDDRITEIWPFYWDTAGLAAAFRQSPDAVANVGQRARW